MEKIDRRASLLKKRSGFNVCGILIAGLAVERKKESQKKNGDVFGALAVG